MSPMRVGLGRERSWRRIWGAPTVVGAVIAGGLAGALLLDGPAAQTAVCAALALPVAVVLWCLSRAT